MFHKKENLNLSIKEYNQISKEQKLLTWCFFLLYDGAIELEENIKKTPIVKDWYLNPYLITSVASAILFVLLEMLAMSICEKRKCWENRGKIDDFIFAIAAMPPAISLFSCVTWAIGPASVDTIENSLKVFIQIVEFLEKKLNDDSKDLIFRDLTPPKELVSVLRKLHQRIKMANGSVDQVEDVLKELRPIISKIIQHLKTLDEEGYFSNYLTEQEVKKRNDNGLYMNYHHNNVSNRRSYG